jgi:hypothetical protein
VPDSHDVGRLFNLAASTEKNGLIGAGHVAFTDRISSVQSFALALTSHGMITGGVVYYGHAGQTRNGLISAIAPGESPGVDTNVYEGDVSLLSNAQLDTDAVITPKGCHAGLKPAQDSRGRSVAQLVANQLARPVKAWRVGMFFSPSLTTRYPQGGGPSAEPVYMLPAEGNAMQPCTFMPNQPEPAKCGGVR